MKLMLLKASKIINKAFKISKLMLIKKSLKTQP